jgi:hypothetical protein
MLARPCDRMPSSFSRWLLLARRPPSMTTPPLAPSTACPAYCGATAALSHTASLSPRTFYRWMCHRSSSPPPPPQIINSNLDSVAVATARTILSSSDAATPPLPSHTTCMAPHFDTAVFSASDHGI